MSFPRCSQRLVDAESVMLPTSSSYNEKAVTIAVSLLKQKSYQNTQTLKDLLTFIPNPNHIKGVLMTAVIELIHTCPQAAFWVFQHPEVLEPEIRVRDIIAQELARKMLSWGYTGDDFHFTLDHRLEIKNEATKQSLLSYKPAPDDEGALMLIHAILM